jgi:iron complex outermembrane receptor protein
VDLKPETSNMYSLGGDYRPSEIPNLKLGVTYWWTSYKNIVDIVHPGAPDYFSNSAWSNTYIINPTLTQLQTMLTGVPLLGISNLSQLYAGGASPYIFIDARLHNIGAVKAAGLDFDVSYAHDIPFGTLFGSVAGSYKLQRDQQLITGSSFVDYLSNGTTSPLGLIGTLGLMSGPYAASVAVKYTSGYDVPTSSTLNSLYHQTSVDSFTTVDLYLSADLGRLSVIKDAELTLNIDNALNTDPPYSNNGAGIGYTNGGTIGRLITVGIRAKF